MCENIDTSYRQLSSKLSQKHSLSFYVAMFEENPEIFTEFNIEAVPQIILYKDRKRVQCDYDGLYAHSVE